MENPRDLARLPEVLRLFVVGLDRMVDHLKADDPALTWGTPLPEKVWLS
jgi:hypothetical protein